MLDGREYFLGNHRLAMISGSAHRNLKRVLKEIADNAQSVIVVGIKPSGGVAGEVLGFWRSATLFAQTLNRRWNRSIKVGRTRRHA